MEGAGGWVPRGLRGCEKGLDLDPECSGSPGGQEALERFGGMCILERPCGVWRVGGAGEDMK